MAKRSNSSVPVSIVLRQMWLWNTKVPWLFVLVLILNPITDVFQSLLLPLVISWWVDIGTTLHGSSLIAERLAVGLGTYLGVSLIGIGLQRVCDNAGIRLSVRVATLVRKEVLNKCLAHSEHFHTESRPGELIEATDQLLSAQDSLTTFITEQVSAMLVQFVGADAILLFIAPLPAVFMAVWSVFLLFILYHMAAKRMKRARIVSKKKQEVTGHFSEAISFAKLLKVMGKEESEVKRQVSSAKTWADGRLSLSKYNIYANVVIEILMLAVRLGIFGFSFWQIALGRMTYATFILLQLYLNQLISALRMFIQNLINLQTSIADASKMIEIMRTPVGVPSPSQPQDIPDSDGGIEIVFDNVSFQYPGMQENEWVLKNFTLRIGSGEHIAFVGPSGSAKTTILRLLLRLWDPQEGFIRLNGRDIREIDPSLLKRYFSYVPQSPDLLHRTILENILFGTDCLDLRRAEAAAQHAHIHSRIMTLENTYYAIVGERGTNLSGGECQRLGLARALAKDAPIFLLDEATSALDGLTENAIQTSLEELLVSKTCILVAHRLSTVQHVPRIIVLVDGTVAEEGSHSELLARQGLYWALWRMQIPASGNPEIVNKL